MPPNMKKASPQTPRHDLLTAVKIEDEKENRCSNLVLKKSKHKNRPIDVLVEEKKVEEIHLGESSSHRIPNAKFKALGFWSKKLLDLEENQTKNKKCGLYEFSETDESESFFKTVKKKQKPKARIQKKRQPVVPEYKKLMEKKKKVLDPEKKLKPICKAALMREKITITKKEKKLVGKTKKFTFSTNTQSLGITSTPAVTKKNLIGDSDFWFLSPIIKEEVVLSDNILKSMPHNSKIEDSHIIINSGQETPKVETKLKRISCRRVLRSGKVIGA